MTDIGRKKRHLRVDVGALAMPAQDRADDKGVPEVVNPRLRTLDSGEAEEPSERAVHVVVDEPRCDERDEEARGARPRMHVVALLRVATERAHDGAVQDNLARLPELALAYDAE